MVPYPIAIANHAFAYQSFDRTFLYQQILNFFSLQLYLYLRYAFEIMLVLMLRMHHSSVNLVVLLENRSQIALLFRQLLYQRMFMFQTALLIFTVRTGHLMFVLTKCFKPEQKDFSSIVLICFLLSLQTLVQINYPMFVQIGFSEVVQIRFIQVCKKYWAAPLYSFFGEA